MRLSFILMQFVELTEKALDFLKRDFVAFDADGVSTETNQQNMLLQEGLISSYLSS